jgi:hypothetical protein
MSRNSSRKSNNSILVSNGKLERNLNPETYNQHLTCLCPVIHQIRYLFSGSPTVGAKDEHVGHQHTQGFAQERHLLPFIAGGRSS